MADREKRKIPDAVVLVGYLAGVVVLGALLAPWLYWAGQWAVGAFAESGARENAFFEDIYRSVERSPFTRFFNRGVLIAALVLLWPTFRLLKKGGAFELGLERNPHRLGHLFFGFCLAGGGLLVLAHLLVAKGLFFLDLDSGGLAKAWVSALTAGLGVAVVEEFLFRGGMLGLLRRSMGALGAMLLVSALFAIVHFLEVPEEMAIGDEEMRWTSGLALLGSMLANLGNTEVVVAELLLLFVVGLALASTRLRSRSLWMPIGLHAGWVFGVQVFSALAEPSRPLRQGGYLPWMGDDLKIGIFPLLIVAATWWATSWFLGKDRPGKA